MFHILHKVKLRAINILGYFVVRKRGQFKTHVGTRQPSLR